MAVAPPKAVVVAPAYNERDDLPALAGLLADLPMPNPHLRVVDDNSPGGDVVSATCRRVLQQPRTPCGGVSRGWSGELACQPLRAASGPVMRLSRGRVEAMMPSEMTRPRTTSAKYAMPGDTRS